jgi:hypothetical protein
MSKVLIVVEASQKEITDSPITFRTVSALKQAIATYPNLPVTVQVVAANVFQSTDSVNRKLDIS